MDRGVITRVTAGLSVTHGELQPVAMDKDSGGSVCWIERRTEMGRHEAANSRCLDCLDQPARLFQRLFAKSSIGSSEVHTGVTEIGKAHQRPFGLGDVVSPTVGFHVRTF